MKLYVINNARKKVYLNLTASSRRHLAHLIGDYTFYLGNELYSVEDVRAENDSNSTASGAVVGGAVGAFAGPAGLIIGGLLGGLIGNSSDEKENLKVNRFNNNQ